MSTNWAFDHIKNKHNLYRGEDYMKKYWKSLREHLKYIVAFEKKNVTVNKKRVKYS